MMTKKDQDLLDSTIEELERTEDEDIAREDELIYMTERLCQMDSKDYRHFMRYMRCERRARKHLGSMSSDA